MQRLLEALVLLSLLEKYAWLILDLIINKWGFGVLGCGCALVRRLDGVVADQRLQDADLIVEVEQAAVGDQLPQHHAQREDVDAPVQVGVALRLLGRHVRELALQLVARVWVERFAARAMPKSTSFTWPS